MNLPLNKTKIVCTIGPASDTVEVMERMVRAGMNVARLNFSHGDFRLHEEVIGRLHEASARTGRPITIMADLPGPKMRIGVLEDEPVQLEAGDLLTLTTDDIRGNSRRLSVSFSHLPKVVKTGDALYLNDGFIQLEVLGAEGNEVRSRVIVGGELRSRKGLNLPGIDLGMSAFTVRDRDCLEFALKHGVHAVSQSFVERADDIRAVREAAMSLGHKPFVLAKIERARALDNLDEILDETDGIMVARGDLGVEVPIEQMPHIQKSITAAANLKARPVITATQMLESMISSRRPTRAEATDVANAILDGTDCVMLSEESAMGRYPVESVAMLAAIASDIEPHRPGYRLEETLRKFGGRDGLTRGDLIALSLENTMERVTPAAVIVPTLSGQSARSISRFKPRVWVTAVSPSVDTCRRLQFSYGVWPEHEPEYPEDWNGYARGWVRSHDTEGDIALLAEGPSPQHPEANHRMEIIDLDR